MKRMVYALVLAAVLLGPMALAADPVMGDWKGEFTTKGWQNRSVSAKVIGESHETYRVDLTITAEGEQWPKITLQAYRRETVAVIIGRTGLPEEQGGMWLVTGEAVNGKMTCKVYNKQGVAEFTMTKQSLESPTLGAAPPEGAVVLFDGTNMDEWILSPGNLRGGNMELSANDFLSKKEFGDCLIHLEFMSPYMPDERGQGRGNSGVYVQGKYEVQVLDSYGDDPADNLCGGIYKIATPLVCASAPPDTWQTYDITFQAARFGDDGKKTQNARITVVQNGITIHDDVELPARTAGGLGGDETPTGPIFLQNHGDRVKYRNIWVLPR